MSADFHLDIRQFNSQQRWRDFLDTFIKVTTKVRELDVDAFVMAGDIFHKYRPHPGVVRLFLKEIAKIDCPIILIRGNHDSPQILFEKYGGDTLHLIRDVSKTVYLNRKNTEYELEDVCFMGLGYIGFNADREIKKVVEKSSSKKEIKVGIFHQLLDYPGIPEKRAEVSKSFLKGLGFDFVLMGHYHVAFSEQNIFSPGSPEYWSFDQAEQIKFNLDTKEIKAQPAKKRGFYLINTEKGDSEFIKIKPARQMFCITYETDKFSKAKHLPIIKDHLEQFDLQGAMIKTIVKGKHDYGRLNLSKKIRLNQPLLHTTNVMLSPSHSFSEKTDILEAHTNFLTERGIPSNKAQKLAKWLEQNKDQLANLRADELLQSLRETLQD